MKQNYNVCGKRIRLARLTKEMAQVELSAALSVEYNINISQNSISDLERGERAVKDYELMAFSEILEVDILWLLFGDDIGKVIEKK